MHVFTSIYRHYFCYSSVQKRSGRHSTVLLDFSLNLPNNIQTSAQKQSRNHLQQLLHGKRMHQADQTKPDTTLTKLRCLFFR